MKNRADGRYKDSSPGAHSRSPRALSLSLTSGKNRVPGNSPGRRTPSPLWREPEWHIGAANLKTHKAGKGSSKLFDAVDSVDTLEAAEKALMHAARGIKQK